MTQTPPKVLPRHPTVAFDYRIGRGLLPTVTMALTCSLGTTRASAQDNAPTSESQPPFGALDISGRPEAPLLDPQQLPRPSVPVPPSTQVYELLDPVDFLQNPEMLLFDNDQTFKVNLKALRTELSSLGEP